MCVRMYVCVYVCVCLYVCMYMCVREEHNNIFLRFIAFKKIAFKNKDEKYTANHFQNFSNNKKMIPASLFDAVEKFSE